MYRVTEVLTASDFNVDVFSEDESHTEIRFLLTANNPKLTIFENTLGGWEL